VVTSPHRSRTSAPFRRSPIFDGSFPPAWPFAGDHRRHRRRTLAASRIQSRPEAFGDQVVTDGGDELTFPLAALPRDACC